MLSGFFIHPKSNQMAKIIFMLWLLSGKVQHKLDDLGYRDYCDGRPLYIMDNDSLLYKGEILNFIRTNKLSYNEDLSDRNGRIKPINPIDTIVATLDGQEVDYPLYKNKKGVYVIDKTFKTKIYLK
jgi:hypothetical protein